MKKVRLMKRVIEWQVWEQRPDAEPEWWDTGDSESLMAEVARRLNASDPGCAVLVRVTYQPIRKTKRART